MNPHSIFAAIFNDTPTDVVLGGIERMSASHNNEIDSKPRSGEDSPRQQSIKRQLPGVTFSTIQLDKALLNIGQSGAAIGSLATGMDFYLQKHLEHGTRDTGSNHTKYSMTRGLIYPVQITASGAEPAEMDVVALASYDGANEPMIETVGQALPSGVVDNEQFVLGSVTLESLALTSMQSMEISIGLVPIPRFEGGDIWPTFIGYETTEPTIIFRGLDPAWLGSGVIPRKGKIITHGNTAIYLKKRDLANPGTFVADGTAEHIKITIAGLATIESAFDGSGSAAAETVLAVRGKGPGPLVITRASAIT